MYGSPFFLVHSKLIFISTNKPNFLVGSKSRSTVEQSLIPLQIYSNTMGTMGTDSSTGKRSKRHGRGMAVEMEEERVAPGVPLGTTAMATIDGGQQRQRPRWQGAWGGSAPAQR